MTIYKDPALLQGRSVILHNAAGDPLRFDASQLAAVAKDLSLYSVDGTSGTLRNTANTYVIRTAGTYKFPIVYGNGIKNGIANPAAYTNQGGANQADFVNHLGNLITSPYIEKNANCQPSAAQLLWQTQAGMITTVSIVEGGDCKYIQFNVAEIPTTNGDALIVVKDSGGNILFTCVGDPLRP